MFRARGLPPPAETNAPDLSPDIVEAWRCFHDLTGDRALTLGGAGPIPWTAIDAWARRFDITGTGFDELVHLVRAADGVALSHMSKKT